MMRNVAYMVFGFLLAVSQGVSAEDSTHTGGNKSGRAQPSAKKISDIVDACNIGRGLPSPRNPAVQKPATPPVYRFIPFEGDHPSAPFPRPGLPGQNPEFPGKEFYDACFAKIPRDTAYACMQVIAFCKAETVDGGKIRLSQPINVVDGTPCSAREHFLEVACGQGIEPSRFQAADIQCGPYQGEL